MFIINFKLAFEGTLFLALTQNLLSTSGMEISTRALSQASANCRFFAAFLKVTCPMVSAVKITNNEIAISQNVLIFFMTELARTHSNFQRSV